MQTLKEKVKKSKPLKIIMIGIVVLAALVMISGINKPHFSPFSTAVTLNYPNVLARTEEKGTVIDTQGKRLLITDGENKITAIVETDSSGSPIDKMNGLTILGDTIYVFGSQQYNKGIYLSAEKVVTYNLQGEYQETLYEEKYQADDYVSTPRIQRILADDESVRLTLVRDRMATVLDLKDISKPVCNINFPEKLAAAHYGKKLNKLFCIGKSTNCYVADLKTASITKESYTEMCKRISDSYDVGETEQILIYSYEDASQNLIFSNSGKNTDIPTDLTCSVGVFVKNLLYWLSVTFFTLVLVLFLIWFIVKKMSAKIRIAVLVIGGILLTSVFYTWNNAEKLSNIYSQSLTVQAQQMSLAVSKLYGTTLSDIRKVGIQAYCSDPDRQDQLTEMEDFLCGFCNKQGIEKPLTAQIIMKDDQDGSLYSVAGSDLFLFGERLANSEVLNNTLQNPQDNRVLKITNYFETYLNYIEPVYDTDGHFLWGISTASYEGNLLYTVSEQSVNLFVTLAAIFIVLYISFSAFKTFGQDIKRMRRRDKSEAVARRVDMAGILTFANGLVFAIDAVIVVYVVKSLCADFPPAIQATLIALPMSLQSAGNFLGNVFYTPLRRKFGDRTLGVGSALITVGAMLLMAFSISISNIYFYFVGKLIFGFFNGGLFFILVDTIPYMAEDKTTQKQAINSVLQSSGAAGILSCLTGGYIAEYLSYSAIYILGAVLAGICLIFAFVVFRNTKRTDVTVEQTESPKLREYWKVFLKGPMLMYIVFYVFPRVLMDGYSSYLFPMYTASAGISALLLSNIAVFGQALVYATNDALVALAKKMRPERALVVPMFLFCAGLICFILSPNIYWAIAMLFAYLLLDRMPQIYRRMYISETAVSLGFEAETVQSNYYTVETGLYTVQPTVLSAFVALGMNLACTAVGVFCGCLLGIFVRFNGTRKKWRRRSPTA